MKSLRISVGVACQASEAALLKTKKEIKTLREFNCLAMYFTETIIIAPFATDESFFFLNNKISMSKILFIILGFAVFILLLLLGLWLSPLSESKTKPNPAASDNAVKVVCFFPGWNTNNVPQDEQLLFLKERFPFAEIKVRYWDSKREWNTARKNADRFGKNIGDELATLSESELQTLVLVGHSLGGRVVVRALAHLSDHQKMARRAILLGAAIDQSDQEILKATHAVMTPIANYYNPKDATLKILYQAAELKPALGCIGNKDIQGLEEFEIPRDLPPHRFSLPDSIVAASDSNHENTRELSLNEKDSQVENDQFAAIEESITLEDFERYNQWIREHEMELNTPHSFVQEVTLSDHGDEQFTMDQNGKPIVRATVFGYTFSNFYNHYSYVYLTFFLNKHFHLFLNDTIFGRNRSIKQRTADCPFFPKLLSECVS